MSAGQSVLVSLQFMDAAGKEQKTYVTKMPISGGWSCSVRSKLKAAVKEAEEYVDNWNVASVTRYSNTYNVYINIKRSP